ncbi:MAG: hypothetical protein ACI9D4_002230, partial [Polaribacter sp.]
LDIESEFSIVFGSKVFVLIVFIVFFDLFVFYWFMSFPF